MQIIWKGQSCFQIVSSQGKDNHVNIVIDPFGENTGLRSLKLEADIVLVSNNRPEYNNLKAVSGQPFVVSNPGEYEVKEVFIQGISSNQDSSAKEKSQNTIYTIEAEDLRICHLGALNQKELTSEQLENIGEIDILIIPVGGSYTISAKEAVKIMSQLEPNITIPMQYQIPKLKLKLDGLDKFLKTMGIKKLEPLAKLTVKKRDISPEEAKIVVLNP